MIYGKKGSAENRVIIRGKEGANLVWGTISCAFTRPAPGEAPDCH